MKTYSVIACRGGDGIYHDSVEANDQAEAETKAREQLAEAWRMTDALAEARANGDESEFDAELDGFAVDERLEQAAADCKGFPLPVDLIVAARDVIAAFGGNVPDWIASQVAMLELALKPFADANIPMPEAEPLAVGDEEYLYRLEQRATIQNILGAQWPIIWAAFPNDWSEEDCEAAIRVEGVDPGSIGSIAYVGREDCPAELWVTEDSGTHDSDVYTLVRKNGDVAKSAEPAAPLMIIDGPGEIREAREGELRG